MAHFLILHKPSGTEVRWKDGIVTSNNESIARLIDSRAKTAYEAGWELIPVHFFADNKDAPEHTRDMMAVLALVLFETQFGGGLLPDAEVVELDQPSTLKELERQAEASSTLPGKLVLWN